MVFKRIPVWSRACIFKPKDNLQSHVLINKRQFKASYQYDPCPPSMALILAGEYGRIYNRERIDFANRNYVRTIESHPNVLIVKRFYQWLDKFNANKANLKRYCCKIPQRNN